jgi:uroporphyrinogen decarboxylase
MEKNHMLKDEMSPMQRMQAIAEGRPTDRLPFAPLVGETMAPLIGTTISKYRHSAQVMVEVETAIYEMFGQDGVGVGPGYQGPAEALGTQLIFPENEIPYVKEPAIKDWDDLEGMTPVDPKRSEKMSLYLTALDNLKEKLGAQVPVGSFIGGPLSIAAFVRGTDLLLRDLTRNPEKVHRLLQLATESALLYIDAVLDLECQVSIADPVASGSLIGAKTFREFVKPYLKQYADRVIERTGVGPMLHICGNTTRIWRDMVETGASTLSLDNVIDMGKAKAMVGEEVCLMGNVDPVNVIAKGTRKQIFAAVQDCLIKTADSPKGFILASGCQIPIGTPLENIHAFADAARTLGRLPLNLTGVNEIHEEVLP